MIIIDLTRGAVTVIDDGNAHLKEKKWYQNNTGYAAREENNRTVLMHRLIMEAKPGQEVDHINGDKLDNRKSNLRFVTRRQNLQNRTWPMKGVSKKSDNTRGPRRWVARITVDGKLKFLGDFYTPEEAENAYREAARFYFGEYARCA